MNSRTGLSIAALAGLVLSGCAERSDPGLDPAVITGPAQAQVPAQCQTGDLAQAARGFFSNPEQRDVAEALRAMEDACAAGDDAGVTQGGWGILRTMERVLDDERGGDVDDGSTLANGLVGLLCDADPTLCAVPPDPITPADLGSQGIFAVRGGGTEPILARGLVPFVDFEGDDNDALWLLLTSASSWTEATNAGGPVLMYGHPSSYSVIPVAELPFEDLGYELHSFPNVDGFNDGLLHVATCFENEVELPHLNGDESQPTRRERLQREGTILQEYDGITGADCGTFRAPYEMAFADGPVGRMLAWAAETLLPRPLYAALMTDRRTPLSSGSPIDFSTLAPVAANPMGSLVFVDAPQDGFAGQALPVIRVQALSGEGTPMERVRIQLIVAGNEGEPAGASFCDVDGGQTEDCGDIAFTVEELDGYGTLAEFTDAALNKPGGYRICARALLTDGGRNFQFEDACSEMIHIKN